MSKYGCVYKLSKDCKNYYGSTVMSMAQRMSNHRAFNKKYQTRKCASVELFVDNIDPKVEIVETIIFEELRELREREDYYIKNFDCINKIGAIFDRKQYELYNKDIINQKQRDRRKLMDTTEKIVCDICGSKVNKSGIYRHKKTIKCKGTIHLKKNVLFNQ